MSCDVDSLPLQAHANYGTWSIVLTFSSLFYLLRKLCTTIFTKRNTKIWRNKNAWFSDSSFVDICIGEDLPRSLDYKSKRHT